jgi:predicted nucleic acid-binding protein
VRLVVSDTGPVLHLYEAGSLEILSLFGKVDLVPAVLAELQTHAPALFYEHVPAWVNPATPSADALSKASDWLTAGLLHAGEAEALAHAQAVGSNLFLTDDTAARVMAESLGISAHGSLGIILYGAATGHLSKSEAEGHLSSLASRSTLWLSALVRRKAEAALAEIFAD